jgi:hypothetical protein
MEQFKRLLIIGTSVIHLMPFQTTTKLRHLIGGRHIECWFGAWRSSCGDLCTKVKFFVLNVGETSGRWSRDSYLQVCLGLSVFSIFPFTTYLLTVKFFGHFQFSTSNLKGFLSVDWQSFQPSLCLTLAR